MLREEGGIRAELCPLPGRRRRLGAAGVAGGGGLGELAGTVVGSCWIRHRGEGLSAMSTQMRAFLAGGFGELRYEPTGKRIRAVLGDATAVDSTRAALVWEPRRVVPSYTVPAGDIR